MSECVSTDLEVEAAAEITRLLEENVRLREALTPFVRAAEYCEGLGDLDHKSVLVGNFRAARDAIQKGGKGWRDILERLQGPRTPQGGSWPYPNLHDDAADEIKILRGQVEALDNERNRLWTEKLQRQLEIARLKEMVQNAYYEGWRDSASREYSRQEIQKDWETSEVFSALNGEKK